MPGTGDILRQTHGSPQVPNSDTRGGSGGTGDILKRVKTIKTDADGKPIEETALDTVQRYGTDIVKSTGEGLRTGLEGLVSLPGETYNAAQAVSEWFLKKYPERARDINIARGEPGAPADTLAEVEAAKGQGIFPGFNDVRAATNKAYSDYIGSGYEPRTGPGQFAKTTAELATTGSTKAPIRSIIAPAVGTEAGGYFGKQFGHETLGRLLGGGIAATAPTGAIKAIAPGQTGERGRLLRVLQDENVPVTAGQATGRKSLQYTEAGPFEGKAGAVAGDQSRAFTKATLSRAGVLADEASPQVMDAAFTNVGHEYDDLVRATGGVPMDQQLQQDLLDRVIKYQRLAGNSSAPAVEDYMNRMVDAAHQNGGRIPADVYQSIKSDIATDLRNTTNADTKAALRGLQEDMHGSIGRTGGPEQVAKWKDIDNRYRNLKIIEKTMLGPGADTAEGQIAPAQLRNAAAGSDKSGYVRGRGDFNDLARAGALMLKPLPQSGTAGRLAPTAIAAALGTGGAGVLSGDWRTALAGLVAGVAPAATGAVLTSGPVRRALVANAAGTLPAGVNAQGILLQALEDRRRQQLGLQQ